MPYHSTPTRQMADENFLSATSYLSYSQEIISQDGYVSVGEMPCAAGPRWSGAVGPFGHVRLRKFCAYRGRRSSRARYLRLNVTWSSNCAQIGAGDWRETGAVAFHLFPDCVASLITHA